MTCVHPLITKLQKPEYFTDPFCYEPHPLCLLAAEEVMQEMTRIHSTEGKMVGVLVVESVEGLAFLTAYSPATAPCPADRCWWWSLSKDWLS